MEQLERKQGTDEILKKNEGRESMWSRSCPLITMVVLIATVTFFSPYPAISQPIQHVPSKEWTDEALLSSANILEKIQIPVQVKGIYVTGRTAGNSNLMKLLNLVNETELNAMVIDVKEDEGRLTYKSTIPLVRQIHSDKTNFISDVDKLLNTLHDHHVYTIARIVCFKDPFLSRMKAEWAMQKKTGGVWTDKKGTMWIDPYRKEVWDYNIAIAKEAAKKGFREIQFDYVRFPDNGKRVDQEVEFHQQNGKAKQEVIADFLAYARKELAPYHVFVSADVFGLVPSVPDDMGLGQKWELISSKVDYVSPMMYPSHYARGTYEIKIPDAQPYETIYYSLQDAQKRDIQMRNRGQHPAIIRPWYQDFTARWVKGHITYGPREVALQIKAGQDAGIDQYLIWDAANTYSEAAWRKSRQK